jgi:hypothetical protein
MICDTFCIFLINFPHSKVMFSLLVFLVFLLIDTWIISDKTHLLDDIYHVE